MTRPYNPGNRICQGLNHPDGGPARGLGPHVRCPEYADYLTEEFGGTFFCERHMGEYGENTDTAIKLGERGEYIDGYIAR